MSVRQRNLCFLRSKSAKEVGRPLAEYLLDERSQIGNALGFYRGNRCKFHVDAVEE